MNPRVCPGASNIRGTPTLAEKRCPVCGEAVEVFSNEVMTNCKCGNTIYNELQSCVKWCAFARECVGDEIYERMTGIIADEQSADIRSANGQSMD